MQLGKFRKKLSPSEAYPIRNKSQNSGLIAKCPLKMYKSAGYFERLLNLTSEIRLNVSGFAATCRKSIARNLQIALNVKFLN